MVMPFSVKNGPLTFQGIVNRTLKKYLDKFMKIFLDDFMVYDDMEIYFIKLRFCFQKFWKYKSSLHLEKCAFMVFSRLILGFIVSKKGIILDLKKVQAIINMLVPTNPQQIQVFNGMVQFYKCFIKNFAFIMALITKLMRKTKPFIWTIECQEA